MSAPELEPEEGYWPIPFAVTVTATTAGSTIYYTTNGLDPVQTSGTVASGGTINIERSLTLKARAYTVSGTSSITQGDFIITGMVSAADFHALALTYDGKVSSWGDQSNGALGNGSTASSDLLTPTAFLKTGSSQITNALWIGSGNGHTLVVDKDGYLWASGRNQAGQLGDNTTTERTIAVQVVSSTTAGTFWTRRLTSGGSIPKGTFSIGMLIAFLILMTATSKE